MRMQQHHHQPLSNHREGERIENGTNKIEFRALNKNILGCFSFYDFSSSSSHFPFPFHPLCSLHLNSATKTHTFKHNMMVLLVCFMFSEMLWL